LRGFSQADVLFEWRRTERSSATDCAIDGSLSPLILHRDLDARAESRAVGFHALQFDADPVVAMAGIFEEAEHVAVATDGAAGYREDILVAIAVDVGKGHRVPLVNLAGA